MIQKHINSDRTSRFRSEATKDSKQDTQLMFGRFYLLFATATFATTVLSHSRQVVAFGVDPMSSPTTRHNANKAKDAPVILLIGSCGLDRLLAVSSYPVADAKIRTNSYTEVGGGNAANTASGTSI